MRAAAEEARKARLARIRALPEAEIHRAVIDSYIDYPIDTNALPAFRASRLKLAELVGTLKDEIPTAHRYGVSSGYESIRKREVSVVAVQFNDFLHGAPELIRWLETHGATAIHYDLIGSSIYNEVEEAE